MLSELDVIFTQIDVALIRENWNMRYYGYVSIMYYVI